MKRKIWLYLFLLIIVQVLFFIIPTLVYSKMIMVVSILLNSSICWWLIKSVEKMYYDKYKNWNSLLYMICPLLGEVIILGGSFVIFRLDSLFFLFRYYLVVYVLVYIINVFYVAKNNF